MQQQIKSTLRKFWAPTQEPGVLCIKWFFWFDTAEYINFHFIALLALVHFT